MPAYWSRRLSKEYIVTSVSPVLWVFSAFLLSLLHVPLFSIPFPSHMFHLTVQRKILKSKEVLCFHWESWELFSVGFVWFFFQIFNYPEKGRESWSWCAEMRQSAALHNAHNGSKPAQFFTWNSYKDNTAVNWVSQKLSLNTLLGITVVSQHLTQSSTYLNRKKLISGGVRPKLKLTDV